MIKHMASLAFGLSIILLVSMGSLASGIVTFQIEVVPGFTVSSPDQLLFDGVAPGRAVERDLSITVWSNVPWELMVRSLAPGSRSLNAEIEYATLWGKWETLSSTNGTVCTDQPPTGQEGVTLSLPFRFTGSYDQVPGEYSIDIELTVVPVI